MAATKEKPLNPSETDILQLGVVVKDINKTVAFLEAIGLGPFKVGIVEHASAMVLGEKQYYKVKLATAQQGGVEIELIEHLDGVSAQQQAFAAKGESLHHVMFKVRNLDETLKRFSKLGIDTVLEDRFIGGGGMAYVDASRLGGMVMELVQLPENYQTGDSLSYIDRREMLGS